MFKLMIRGAAKSWTIRGNLIFILLFILSQYVFISEEEKSTLIKFFTSPELQEVMIVIFNILRRFWTTQSLQEKAR